jgi:hypothetical protein
VKLGRAGIVYSRLRKEAEAAAAKVAAIIANYDILTILLILKF